MLGRRLTIPFYISLVLFLMFIQGCGDLTSTSATLSVKILGVNTTPTGATGSLEPQSESFTIQSVSMQDSNGKTITLSSGDPQVLVVINRPQIIYSGKLDSAYEGKAFSNLSVVLDSHITATSLYAKDLPLTLKTSTLSYAGPFTIVKGKDFNFLVDVEWENTVTRKDTTDTISAPTLSIKIQ